MSLAVQNLCRLILVTVFAVALAYDFAAAQDASDFALAVDENGKTGFENTKRLFDNRKPGTAADPSARPAAAGALARPAAATAVGSAQALEQSGEGRALVEATLLAQLRQGYRELCADCRVEFRDVKFPPFATEDAPDLKIGFKDLKWGGSFLLPVEFLGETQSYISGQVRLHRRALQAARTVNALTAIGAADVREDWTDVTFLKDEPATLADLDGAVAKKFLSLRQTILKSDLRLPQIVSRGQMIKVVTGNESFEISGQFRAEENGSLGDYVRVKNDQNRILSVRVTAPGTARLE